MEDGVQDRIRKRDGIAPMAAVEKTARQHVAPSALPHEAEPLYESLGSVYRYHNKKRDNYILIFHTKIFYF